MNKQEDLEYQRMFLSATLENLDAAVVACNDKGELILFNRIARDWHGLDPINIPQTEWARHYNLYMEDGVSPMDIKTVPLVRAFHGEEIYNIGMVIAAKGQPIRHVLANARPIKGKNGQVLGAIAVMHDITERKSIENVLRESEDRYRRLMESTIDYIYTVRLEGGRAVETIHGPGCLAVTGYSCEEYKKDPNLWYQMIHPEDRSKVVEMAQRVLQGVPVEGLEHRIYHRNGTICWLRNTIVLRKDTTGRVVSYDGLLVDITARKQAEEALKESETRFSTIFRVNPVGVALTRMSDNKLVDVNNAFADIFAYKPEEFIGHSAKELNLWFNPEERERLIQELKKHGQVQQAECKFRQKSAYYKEAVKN